MSLLLYLFTAALLLWLTRRWVRSLGLPAAIALVLFPLCFTGRALFIDGVYAPVDLAYASEPLNWMRLPLGITAIHNGWLNDVATQMIPYRQGVRDALAHGEWPLWNRFTMAGDLLAASAQPAAYSPFTLLACLLPAAKSFTYTASVWFFIAGLSAFLFLRELECEEPVSAFAAVAWMFSTAIAFFILWPIGESWALLPFVLLAVRRVVAFSDVAAACLLLCALTLLVLAGHPETLLHVVSIGGVYGLFEIACRRQRIGRALLAAGAAGVVALLLSAIYLLPIVEAAPQTMEHQFRSTLYAGSPRGADPQEMGVRFASDMLDTLNNRLWNLERLQQLPPDPANAGSIVLACAVYAMWRVRRREKWFFLGLLVFCLLARAGWPPLMNGLAKLPLFDIAFNERFSFGGAACLVVLAALGIDELIRRRDYLVFAVTATLVLIVITTACMMLEGSGVLRANIESFGDYRLFAAVAMLAVAVPVTVFRPPARVLAASLIALVLLQRTMQESGVYPTYPAGVAYPHVPLFDALKEARRPFRIAGVGLLFIPGASAMYGLEDVRGYAAMTLDRYVWTWPLWCVQQSVWFNRVDDLNRPFLSLLNVRYAITWATLPVPPGWRLVSRFWRAGLLENTQALDRAFVPRQVRIGIRDMDAVMEMSDEKDFSDRAWIRADVRYDSANGPGRVTSIEPRKLGFNISVSMEKNGWVVISEPAWRGWRAYVDGRRIQHQIADVAFLGVYVPKGDHRIRLVYWPESFVTGRAVSFTTLAGLVVFAFLRGRWARVAGRIGDLRGLERDGDGSTDV